jgi:hypothetical protein
MSAAEALKAARAAGIKLAIDGDDLVLEASAAPPPAVIDRLTGHKTEIVAMLRPRRDGWSADDWQAFFDERAGIAEFDGGLSRAEAEAQAFAACVAEWLNRNPMVSPPGRCLECGDPERFQDVLSYGIESRHAWLHSRCWPGWQARRKAEAITSLKVMGIVTSSEETSKGGA